VTVSASIAGLATDRRSALFLGWFGVLCPEVDGLALVADAELEREARAGWPRITGPNDGYVERGRPGAMSAWTAQVIGCSSRRQAR
jgi:hypothetical protein